ncbi:MAG TPA: hypothetical protein VEI82_06860, partial [Myxococcota bacterium]|nr:hypothetical protein [Myxococcota bacterium]
MNRRCCGLLLAALLLCPTRPARADAAADQEIARDDEIAELKRQLATVVNEVETLRAQLAAPEETHELQSQNGFGPAASKIY